jgi:hypothetical protein
MTGGPLLPAGVLFERFGHPERSEQEMLLFRGGFDYNMRELRIFPKKPDHCGGRIGPAPPDEVR